MSTAPAPLDTLKYDLDVHRDDRVSKAAAELALEGFTEAGALTEKECPGFESLRAAGSELWLDTGDQRAIEPLWCREFTALTTNNTLVNQVVKQGGFDSIIPHVVERLKAAKSMSEADLAFELGFVVNARLALSLVQRFGALVSVELHPAMANDVEASLVFARRYFALCPENFIIKVPLQPAGFLVVRRLYQESIPVNYTLGFSARQNYLAALFSRPSYVNVFLGRLNGVVEENHLGSPENIGEKTTLASQEALREAKAFDKLVLTQQIAASVRNGQQIADLAGVDVFTMPPKAAQEFLDLGLDPEKIRAHQAKDLSVTLGDTPHRADVEGLWTVDDAFKKYAQELSAQETAGWSPETFAAQATEKGIRLFHNWTEEELAVLREDGKIPKIEKWNGVPLDELMTQSALQSFAKDQKELDDRLLGLAK